MTALDPERRSQLLGAKLRALVPHLGLAGELGPFPGGATMLHGRRAAVLAEDAPARALGPAMAWARQHDVHELHVVVPDHAGALARMAAAFATPPTVWWSVGRDLHAVEPEPFGAPAEAPPEALALAPQLTAAGADVVVEHGVVTGEVLGLEIARVVVDERGARIEAGVGRHDREAFAMIHGDLPTAAALETVVGAARRHRSATSPEDHPLRRLATERWLREAVLADPERVGASALVRHEGPRPRPNVKEPWPAVAVGVDDDMVVVCSVGIDLDVVPFAADARLLAASPDSQLVVVVPERDAHPATAAMAASLRHAAEIVAVPGDWRSLA
jgi:hypothetical protein